MSEIENFFDYNLDEDNKVESNIDWQQILAENRLTFIELEKYNLSQSLLESIFFDYEAKKSTYSKIGQIIVRTAIRFKSLHSVRYRVKDSNHLISKIIRKKLANPDRNFSLSNYDQELTDLVGIRILYISKDDLELIDTWIRNSFDLCLNELPKMFYRVGDIKTLESASFERIPHTHGYRSAHYIIKQNYNNHVYHAELQVRSIFEEGWSEIDHKILYPNNLENSYLKQFSRVLNSLSGNADELATLMLSSIKELEAIKQPLKETIDQQNQKLIQYERLIQKSNLKSEEKTFMKTEIFSQYLVTIDDTIRSINNSKFIETLEQFKKLKFHNNFGDSYLSNVTSIGDKFNNSGPQIETAVKAMLDSYEKTQFQIDAALNILKRSLSESNIFKQENKTYKPSTKNKKS